MGWNHGDLEEGLHGCDGALDVAGEALVDAGPCGWPRPRHPIPVVARQEQR